MSRAECPGQREPLGGQGSLGSDSRGVTARVLPLGGPLSHSLSHGWPRSSGAPGSLYSLGGKGHGSGRTEIRGVWPPEVGRGGLKLRPWPSGPPPARAPSPEALESPRCKGQGRQQTAARHHSYLRDKPRNWLGSLSAIGWGQRLTINWKYWQPPLRSPRLAAPGFPARLGTRRACAH